MSYQSQVEQLMFYRDASIFWRRTAQRQLERCLESADNREQNRADMEFYLVAVARIREVAHQAKNRKVEVRAAIKTFDDRHPQFRELRNAAEHLLGHSSDLQVIYFADGVWVDGEGFHPPVIELEDHDHVEELAGDIVKAVEERLAELASPSAF
jgi:uncharacterized protein (UPF0305 family)